MLSLIVLPMALGLQELTSLFIYRQQMMAAPSGLGSKQGL